MWITNLTQKIERLAVKIKFFYRIASRYYQSIIKNEIDLADITKNDHILCIGGGSCPFSAILLHQTTGAKVTVIDNNKCCIPKARKIIKRLGIGKSIKVLCQDGRNIELEFSKYSVIHLALQVAPMENVLTQLEKQITPGTKLLIRKPKKQLEKLYSRFPILYECRYAAHKLSNIDRTILFVKKEGA